MNTKTKKQPKLPDANKALHDILSDFNFQSGHWTILSDACEKSAGYITLGDGRKAEVQVKVTTDEDDFLD
jgi:hypothetical protein